MTAEQNSAETAHAREAALRASFAAGGHTGAAMDSLDWTTTPLGPTTQWPASLVSVVTMLLASRAQIALFWGPQYVALYNDAYAPTIGDKHPRALGRPAVENWTELWDDLEPLLAGVRRTGVAYSARDRPFVINRHGFLEDVYFDVSYDPVPIADGSVGGVFCIVSETTERVVANRRLGHVARLTAALVDGTDVDRTVKNFLTALSDATPDIAFARLRVGDNSVFDVMTSAEIGVVPTELADYQPLEKSEIWPSAPLAGDDTDSLEEGGGSALAMAFPLRLGERLVFGDLLLGVDPAQGLDDEYRQFLGFVAERLTIALAKAAALENERQTSITLQRALLPERMPEVAGIDLAAIYLPATAGLDVGGDWYDALQLFDGRLSLVIGDVAGKGVHAGALMGQLRTALRSYLLEGHSPAAALALLNEFALHTVGTMFITVLAAVLDPATGALVYSTAGHLLPLVATAEQADEQTIVDYLDAYVGPPIGVIPHPKYADATWQLDPGSCLALYTDGLVEYPGEDIDAGMERAREALEIAVHASDRLLTADELARQLVQLRPPATRRDDIAVLTVRRARRTESQ